MSRRLASCVLGFLFSTGCTELSVVGPDLPDRPEVSVEDLGLRDAPASDATEAPNDIRDSGEVSDAQGTQDASEVLDASDAPDARDGAPEDAADALEEGEDITVPLSDVREIDARTDVPDDFQLLDISSDASPVGAAPSLSSALAITPDDRVVVAANRRAGTLTVLLLAGGIAPTLLRTQDFALGALSEPWKVCIAPDGDTAYAILRRDQQVVRITSLHGAPRLDSLRGRTGSEPTSLAVSPNGQRLYVANFADGTLTVLNTMTLALVRTVDLNAPLALSGLLGPGLSGRQGLAHPRALVITNDGDASDSDEVLYATEFFAQRRLTGAPAGLDRFDQDHLGVVYRVDLSTHTPTLHTLAPVPDMGFRDTNNSVTGCYPNQLHAITLNAGRVYVTAVCTSPRGPTGLAPAPAVTDAGTDASADVPRDVPRDLPDVTDADVALAPLVPDLESANFRTEHASAIFVLDALTGDEIPAQRLVLNSRFQSLYDQRRLPDDGLARRMPLIPIDISFAPGTNTAYVLGYGSDAVFRVRYNPVGTVAEFGLTAGPAFIDLAAVAPLAPGQDPVGIAFTSLTNNDALVLNEHSRNISAIYLATQTVTSATATAPAPTGDAVAISLGRRFFVTGTGRWSLRGQSWNSCEACHPDGLTDNVTWFFGRGPRQTLSLDADFDKATGRVQRLFNWTAVFDEVSDFELNTRGNSGGVGAIVHRIHDGASPPRVTPSDRIVFDGSPVVSPQVSSPTPRDGLRASLDEIANGASSGSPRSVLNDWSALTEYLQSVRTPRAPSGLDPASVTAGRALFLTHHCDGCHSGPLWTLATRFYTPSDATNGPTGSLVTRRFTRPAGFPMGVAPPDGPLRLSPFDPANDQIVCALRNVGTWAMNTGVSPMGVNLLEVRANGRSGAPAPMVIVSQGSNGFSPPSLLGASLGAPYLHAGNARSLEELFTTTFRAHHQAFSPSFLSGASAATELRQLVSFLLSIDGSSAEVPPPARVAGSPAFDPNLCQP